MQTTLSERARAFSVDYLLGKRETDAFKSCVQETGSICSSLGEGPPCCHCSVHTICDDRLGQEIIIELCQNDLWESFHRLGTEMIITKTGRRMFPAIRLRVKGLNASSKYRLFLDFLSVDRNKYRYVYHSSKWMVSGNGEAMPPNQTYQHPDSPMDGGYLSNQVISFEKIKLTNTDLPKPGQISLVSMQKFQPRIHIEEVQDDQSRPLTHIITLFPQTSFIAVTAYQNQEITRMKIARNPFAKGFREAGKCRSSLEAMMATFGVSLDSNRAGGERKRSASSHPTSGSESKGEPVPKISRHSSSHTSSESQKKDSPSKTPSEPISSREISISSRSLDSAHHASVSSSPSVHPAFMWSPTSLPVYNILLERSLLNAYYANSFYNGWSLMSHMNSANGMHNNARYLSNHFSDYSPSNEMKSVETKSSDTYSGARIRESDGYSWKFSENVREDIKRHDNS